jgi:hypothetical protein
LDARWRAAGVSAVASLLITAQTWWFGWANWDDGRMIVRNPALKAPLGQCLNWAWSDLRFEAYHPLHMSLLCLESYFFGATPEPYHVVTGALFAVIGGLMSFWLVAAGAPWRSAVVATMLALAHPLMVEIVACVPSQKDLLGLIFGLAALLLQARAPSRSWSRTIATTLLVVAAGLSKSGYFMWGPILLLHSVLFDRFTLRALAPALAGGVGLAISAWLLAEVGLPSKDVHAMDLLVVGRTFFEYARRWIAPVELVPVYCLDPSTANAIVGIGALLGLVTLAFFLRARARWASFGIAIAVLGLAPYLNVIPTPLLGSDRYAWSLAFGGAIAIVDRLQRRTLVFAALVAAALAVLSQVEQRKWRDATSLWSKTAEHSQCRGLPFANLAVARFETGDRAGAEEALIKGIEVAPREKKLVWDLVVAFLLEGDCAPALAPRQAIDVHARLAGMKAASTWAESQGWLASAAVLALGEGEHQRARSLAERARLCSSARTERIERLLDRLAAEKS